MPRERLLVILAVLAVAIGCIYFVVLRPVASEGIVDHMTITGTKLGTSYSIVVFTMTGNHFDDEEVRSLFDETDVVNDTIAYRLEALYDEVFYVVSIRSGDDAMGYFMSRRDFNRVVPGSRIRFNAKSPDESEIRIIKVLN